MLRGLWIAVVAGALSAPLGWEISNRVESDNRFCVSCHLREGQPLHDTKMRDFDSDPARNLAGLHQRAEAEFRCIDCHGGASFANRLRIKAVAARDALSYLLGRFDEPGSMQHPLWDEDCAQCHDDWSESRDDDYHGIGVHNLPEFEYRCVDCHRAHDGRGSAEFAFLERAHVLGVCHQCHEEFQP